MMDQHPWLRLAIWIVGWLTTAIVAIRVINRYEGEKADGPTIASVTFLASFAWPLAVGIALAAAAFMVPFSIVLVGTGWRPRRYLAWRDRRRRHRLLAEVQQLPDLRDKP